MAKIKVKALYTGDSGENFQSGTNYEIEIEDFAVQRVNFGGVEFPKVIYGSVSAFLNNWTAIHVSKK